MANVLIDIFYEQFDICHTQNDLLNDNLFTSKTTKKYEIILQKNDTKSVQKIDFQDIKKESESLIFIGDSRFLGMEKSNTKKYDFFCEIGKGYNWYTDNFSNIEPFIKDDTIIIFGLGVNDLYNIKNYQKLAQSPYFSKMYFLSVNPVDETKEQAFGYTVTNEDIEKFNEQMKEIFGDKYIDSNNYLKEDGFNTIDGLHYDSKTYTKIYDYILLQVMKNNYPIY